MKSRSVGAEQNRDVVAKLDAKKETLKQLKTERRQATGLFDYFKRNSLDSEIRSLEKEIVDLTEEAKKESLAFKATSAVSNAVNNLFGIKSDEEKLDHKVQRQAHADAVREKYHIPKHTKF